MALQFGVPITLRQFKMTITLVCVKQVIICVPRKRNKKKHILQIRQGVFNLKSTQRETE